MESARIRRQCAAMGIEVVRIPKPMTLQDALKGKGWRLYQDPERRCELQLPRGVKSALLKELRPYCARKGLDYSECVFTLYTGELFLMIRHDLTRFYAS